MFSNILQSIFTGKLCWNNFIIKRLQYRCFPWNIARVLKTVFYIKYHQWLSFSYSMDVNFVIFNFSQFPIFLLIFTTNSYRIPNVLFLVLKFLVKMITIFKRKHVTPIKRARGTEQILDIDKKPVFKHYLYINGYLHCTKPFLFFNFHVK